MYAFVAWVAFIWFFVLFCDTIFKTCMFHPYFKILNLTGLDIKPLTAHFRISRYNRFINQMGHFRPLALKIWFNIGAVVTNIVSVPCLLLFIISLYQMFTSLSIEDYNSSLLLPVIPGYNFPSSHLTYFISVTLVCSVVHEFGHALAASREGINIENFGFAVIAVIPLAFVNLRLEQFRQISKWQQMRIVCAGIWHNIVLALLALLCTSSLTFTLSPLYTTGSGVAVVGLHEQLNQPDGFQIGDKINGIGDCDINSEEDWKSCLRQISSRPQHGLCIPDNIHSKPIETCLNSSGCLHFQTPKDEGHEFKEVCLYARQAIQDFCECNTTSDCKVLSSCFFPVLSNKMHRFVTIKKHNKPPVLYLGTLDELFADVHVSHFIQKYKFFPSSFAEAVKTFLAYTIMLSFGLACLNILPVLAFDGVYIIELLVHISLGSLIPRYSERRTIFIWISRLAFVVLICYVLLTAYKFYMFGL